jgi:lysozyme family protein
MTHDLFPFCVHVILAHEGGLTDDPNDEGGITNFGISLRFYKTIFPSATADDIRNLSESQAEQLYRTYWWNKYSYAQFKAVIVAVKVFDMAVDMGPHEAHKLLQSAINSLQSWAMRRFRQQMLWNL